MNSRTIEQLLTVHFPHQPTNDQRQVFKNLQEFLTNTEKSPVLLIKGYAGTGKTSLIKALVKALPEIRYSFVLLAPTGRSAKVMSLYSGSKAHTIHRKIYFIKHNQEGRVICTLQPNKHRNCVFIVDEASMIGDHAETDSSSHFQEKNLLDDLFTYIWSGNNCRLILIGDAAQLPPVKTGNSPALDVEVIRKYYSENTISGELKEVMRQEQNSGILLNATAVRHLIDEKKTRFPAFRTSGFRDFRRLTGEELEDTLNQAYSYGGREDTIIICRSNKRANLFNRQIRSRIFGMEHEIGAGDLLMVVKNNYFWLDLEKNGEFIANGDIIEILKIKKTYELYGFQWSDVTVRMADYPEIPPIDVKIMLDTLDSQTPSLGPEESDSLFQQLMEDYADEGSRAKRYLKVKEDPHFNALQVKFSYAITCHKAQGGQWPFVFVDQGFITDDTLGKEYLRWLYTAITRASRCLWLVNFKDEFFEK